MRCMKRTADRAHERSSSFRNPGLEARLVSRFQWGMVADIERRPRAPDRDSAGKGGNRPPGNDAPRGRHSVHRRKRAVECPRAGRIDHQAARICVAQTSGHHHRARARSVRDKLRPLAAGGAAGLTSYTIQDAVSKDWGVTLKDFAPRRARRISPFLVIAMLLMREMLGMQLVEIGASFGGRDHSTVIHSLERATL